MQASKIKVDQVYAIRRDGRDPKSELVRFRVSAVVTRRERDTGSPHDYASTVEGWIVEDIRGEAARTTKIVTVAPDRILGPYKDQVELAERAKREKEAREAEDKAQREDTDRVRAWLYKMVGREMPKDRQTHQGNPFRVSYGGTTIDIDSDGVALLLEVIDRPALKIVK